MTTAKPRGDGPADHTTPSPAASATTLSGITWRAAPFGVPGGNGSPGRRSNMRSTPRCVPPGRGVPTPDEITGSRSRHRATGTTQRPGNVIFTLGGVPSIGVDFGVAVGAFGVDDAGVPPRGGVPLDVAVAVIAREDSVMNREPM